MASLTSIKYLHINFKHRNPTSAPRKSVENRVLSMKTGGDCENWRQKGRAVDEGLIVLRRRIHEVKMKDGSYSPPLKWWAWEKKWHVRHSADVVEIVGLLQIVAMGARPSSFMAAGAFLVFCVAMAVCAMLGTSVGFLVHAVF